MDAPADERRQPGLSERFAAAARGGSILWLTPAAPPVWEYILDLPTAQENFDYFDTPTCLGSLHIPALFILDEAGLNSIYSMMVVVDLTQGRMIANPDSGANRGTATRGRPMPCSMTRLDLDAPSRAYDIAETQRPDARPPVAVTSDRAAGIRYVVPRGCGNRLSSM